MSTATYTNTARDLEILERLQQEFRFRSSRGEVLRDGRCPGCNRNSLWIHKKKPRLLRCNRENNCGFVELVSERYPDLFGNYSERCPATPEDPKRTAREYLTDRGFNPALIANWYQQGSFRLKNAPGQPEAPTVRIPLWGSVYWERLIDDKHVRLYNRKTNYPAGTRKRGRHWAPPEQTINPGDTVVITEGIFNAWAFLHLNHAEGSDYRVVAALDSSNFPTDLLNSLAGQGITWVLAYDNDLAGQGHTQQYVDQLQSHQETWQVCLTETAESDWADEWQRRRLTRQYVNDGLWRGRLATAPDGRSVAFWQWLRQPDRNNYVLTEFNRALYAYTVDPEARKFIRQISGSDDPSRFWTDPAADVNTVEEHVAANMTGGRISNCLPRFLYVERDPLTDERAYCFEIRFFNNSPRQLVSLDGSCLESPASFNKSLLTRTSGGTFDGNTRALNLLKKRWFDQNTVEVKRCRFAGYDQDTGVYVFPDFGYYQGRWIPKNQYGYIDTGRHRIKTGLSSRALPIVRCEPDSVDWIGDFHTVFGDEGLIVLSWWLGTLFAEQIRDQYQSWPFLELSGEPGSGKTTLIKFLWRCCGRSDDYEGFDPAKSTPVGRSRNLERYSNLPVVVIEADRKTNFYSGKNSFDFNEFKPFYNGGIIRSIGVRNHNNETIEPQFRGGVLISQNASVDSDDDAVTERIVCCQLSRPRPTGDATQSGKSQEPVRPLNTKLANRLERLGVEQLGSWLHLALTLEKTLLEQFGQHLQAVTDRWETDAADVRPRIVLNHAQIAAWCRCLQTLFPGYITDEIVHSVELRLLSATLQRESLAREDSVVVDQFWSYYEYLNNQSVDDVNGNPSLCETLNHSLNPDLIAIHLQEFEEAAAKHNLERLPYRELKRQLPYSSKHPFVGRKNVRSQILNGQIRFCWVFSRK